VVSIASTLTSLPLKTREESAKICSILRERATSLS
jgi:hypothetical protein